jgi:glycosyltransferase involved in cell wall biosynthesis
MEESGVRVWNGGGSGRRELPLVARRLRRYLPGTADVVHTHLFEPSLVGLGVARSLGLPTVSTRHHSNYHARMGKRWHVQLDRLATRWSDVVIAVSEHTAQVLIEDEGADPVRVRTIPNGVDAAAIATSGPETLQALRASLVGADESVRLVLHPARFHPEKGHFELFEAVARVNRESDVRIRLLLAGTGPARPDYEEYIRRIGIQGDVDFLGFRHDIHDLMTVADVVVFPSLAEAFGLALLEAIYLGAPVIASDVGGMPEIVRSLGHGTLVAPGDPAALASAIVKCLDAPPERVDRQAVARLVEERYSFRTMMGEYEGVYEELAGGSLAKGRHA